jgi:hypothetical protein
MMASALRGICAMQRGVTGYDRTVWVAIGTREWLSREDSMCPPRRGVAALHLVFLLQLSPKWGMVHDNTSHRGKGILPRIT